MSFLLEPTGIRGWWWLAAVIAPLAIIAATLLRASNIAPENQGFNVLLLMWMGAIEAALCALLLSLISWVRREQRRRVSLFTAIPGAILLVCFVVWLEIFYSIAHRL